VTKNNRKCKGCIVILHNHSCSSANLDFHVRNAIRFLLIYFSWCCKDTVKPCIRWLYQLLIILCRGWPLFAHLHEYWGWRLLQPGWRLCLYVCQFLWSPQEQQWHFHGRKGSRVCREWQKNFLYFCSYYDGMIQCKWSYWVHAHAIRVCEHHHLAATLSFPPSPSLPCLSFCLPPSLSTYQLPSVVVWSAKYAKLISTTSVSTTSLTALSLVKQLIRENVNDILHAAQF